MKRITLVTLLVTAILAGLLLLSCKAAEDLFQQVESIVLTNGPIPPSAPSDLAASAVSDSQIDLTWTDDSGNEELFQIQRRREQDSDWQDVSTVAPDTTAYEDHGLNASTQYHYRVRAGNSHGNSDWSVEASASTFVTATFTVTYDGNGADGGSAPTDNSRYQTGATVTVSGPGTLSLTGHAFSAWNSAADGNGTEYLVGASLIIGSTDVVLYAQWSENDRYSVTYDGNGNDAGSVPADGSTYEAGDYVTVLGNVGNLEKTGYQFSAWNTAANGTGESYDANDTFQRPNHNVGLFARWTPNTYEIIFNANGGSGSMPNQVVNFDDSVVLTTNAFARTGHTFAGWALTSDASAAYSDGGEYNHGIAADRTLYATWEVQTYSIAYEANGGSGVMANQSVDYGETVSLSPNAFSRTGYTFDGWAISSVGGVIYLDQADYSHTITADRTLYAHWQGNQYTVTFDPQGGASPSPSSKTVVYGSQYGPLASSSMPGFVLQGWWTGPGTTGEQITASTVVHTAHNHTLYANWTWATYSVGDAGPSGGHIFYVNPNAGEDGWRYLEAAPASTEWSEKEWGAYGTFIGGTSDEIGAGKSNTQIVAAWLDPGPEPPYGYIPPAAVACNDLIYNDFSDWFLPSYRELLEMYENLFNQGIGGFSETSYWSSTEYDSDSAYDHLFYSIIVGPTALKYSGISVRAVRSF